jgi:hypothetical protein
MKIIDLQTFREMPSGILFSKYQPTYFGDLCVKDETLENDFYVSQIQDAIECESSEEFAELCIKAEKEGISLKMDFDTICRDGMFEEDQLFAVWEKEDIEQLIVKLTKCLDVAK